MDQLVSTIKFVSAGMQNSTHMPATGDFLLYGLAGIVFLLFAASFILFMFSKKTNSGIYKSLYCSRVSIFASLVSNKILISILGLASVVLLASCMFNQAIAADNAPDNPNEFCPQTINAYVYEDTGNIKCVDNDYIQNNLDYRIKINEISLKSLDQSINANWKISDGDKVIYDNVADHTEAMPNDYFIESNARKNFNIDCGLDASTAKSLINKNVVQIKFSAVEMPEVKGCLKDGDGSSVVGAKATFIGDDKQIVDTTLTDENGNFEFNIKKGTRGHVKLEIEDMETRETDHIVVDKNIDLGTIKTCWTLKSTIPAKIEEGTLFYNGQLQCGFTNLDDTVVNFGKTSSVDAGIFLVYFKPAAKHCWPDEPYDTSERYYTWKIDKLDLDVGLVDQSILYGADFPQKDKWEITYDGFIPGEDPKVLTGDINLGTTYDHRSSNVNKEGYEVNFNGSTLSSPNYDIKYKNGRLYLEQRKTGLTWGVKSWVYDGQAHSTTCSATDLINTDNVEVDLEGNSITNVSESKKTVTVKGLSGDKAVNYFIDPDATKQVDLEITKADPFLHVNDVAVVKSEILDCKIEYNGDASSKPVITVEDDSIASIRQEASASIRDFKVIGKNFGHTNAHVKFAEGSNYYACECVFDIGIAQVWGMVRSLQNLLGEDGQPIVKVRDGILVELVIDSGEEEQIVGQGYSDSYGTYRICVDASHEKDSFDASLRVDVPGVDTHIEAVTVNPKTTNLFNIENLTGIDFYTIEQLRQVSDILSDEKSANSALMDEFNNYLKKDEIWYSNSAGKQPKSVNVDDVSSADPTKCNQDYKNSFVVDEGKIVPENIDLDQFLFLRIIGVNQDKEAFFDGDETGKIAGLTMQAIRSLPRAYPFCGHLNVNWWGDENCFLRKDLSYDGEVITHLNENFKNSILNVSKKTQKSFDSKDLDISNTADKMFILSYSEMCTPGSEDDDFKDYSYYINGAEGEQYQWYKNHNIKGNSFENKDLAKLCHVNSGEEIAEGNARTFQRTTYFDAGTNFLTTNYKGSIMGYAQSKQRIGIVPAFCFGTSSKVFDINMLGDNVDYLTVDGKELSRHKQVVDDASFSFKIVAKEGKTLDSVTVNGQTIEPVSDVYTISNINEQKTIVAKTSGEADAPIIEGDVSFEKNIGDDQSIVKKENQSLIKIVDQDGQVLSSTTSDNDGKYLCVLGTSAIGKTAHIEVAATPGIDAYRGKDFVVVSGRSSKNILLHALDAYTLDELKSVSTWLSSHKDQVDSSCYLEFKSYIKNDVIWYSNSNGQQPSNVSVEQSKFADTSKCNQDYVCSFIQKDGHADKSNVDNYLFLRIIGLNNDELSASDANAGLTFQSVHVLPIAQAISSGSAQWWGNSALRASINDGGSLNSLLNDVIKSNAVSVKKYNQKTRQVEPSIEETDDKFFVCSYSEMWNKNGILAADHSWYGNNGSNTEGKVYDWYKERDINGGEGNEVLKPLVFKNSGVAPGEKLTTWERSVCCIGGDSYFLATDANGSLISSNYNFGETGLALCFAL